MIAMHEAAEDWVEAPEEPLPGRIRYWDPSRRTWLQADESQTEASIAARYANYLVSDPVPLPRPSPLAYFVYMS